jgi:excisionase family DNA binding protein
MQHLLTRSEAAAYLGVKTETLAVWACNKRYSLSYIKVGRNVRYRQTDLDKFVAENTVSMERSH